VNSAAAADPGLTERDPYGEGWLIEARLTGAMRDQPRLLTDPGEIRRWFAAKLAEYRRDGVIAQ